MKDSETTLIVEDEAPDFSLIDVSASDDDFLLASSTDVNTVGNPGNLLAEEAHSSQASNSAELEKPRKYGKCNLRKSLAWDSAFFTNAGVLDPEELSSIIEGAETSVKQKHFLPGIEEDLSKSYDSVSTFESDNLTIESLEADLFCDIRASIQRSSRPSAQRDCSNSKLQRETESPNGHSTNTVEISSSNMVKPKLASKKPTSSIQGPLRTLKPGSVAKQVAKPAVKSKESKLLLPRPPEAVVKSSLIGASATKRTSIGASRAKVENNITGNSKGKVTSLSKVSYQANSSNAAPKTLASSKFSLGSSVLGRTAAVRSSRSSCDSSSSSSSETIKSQCDVNRRKADKNANLPTGSKIRGPSRVAVKSKSRSGDSHLSEYLKSAAKLSSSISPTSSISEWSTESSSSTATVNQKLIGLMPGPTSTQDIIMDSNVLQAQNHSGDSATSGCENHLPGLDQSAKQPSTACAASLSRPGSAKPSGLRMPSAKLGFFDGVKAAAKTPSSGLRSRPALPSNPRRSGALNSSPSGTPNNPRAIVKPEPRRTNMNPEPVQLDDHSMDLPKILNAENVEHHSEISSKVSKNVSLDPTLEENGEVLNGGKHVADSSSEAAKNINLVAAKKEASAEDEKLQSSTNQATVTAGDLHDIIHITDGIKDLSVNPSSKGARISRKESSDTDSVCPSQEVGESDSLKISTIHACQDLGESVGCSPTHENQDSGSGALDVRRNGQAEKQVDGFGTQMEGTNNELEMRSESNGTFQSKNLINEDNSSSILSCPKELCNEKPRQSANLGSGSLSLLCGEASPGSRTPFAIKNSVADLIEVYNSSSGPAVEASVKLDTLPSLEEGQKENC